MPVFCLDRKSTRLNSSHLVISYARFLLRSEEHTSELQAPCNLVCRLLLEKKNKIQAARTCAALLMQLADPNAARRSWSDPAASVRRLAKGKDRSCADLFFFFKYTGAPQILPLSPHHAFPI